MAFETVHSIVSNPLGTARILEAHSTLRRARGAGLTDEQIRAVFPDARKYKPEQLEGFMLIGEDLASGATRFAGHLSPKRSLDVQHQT